MKTVLFFFAIMPQIHVHSLNNTLPSLQVNKTMFIDYFVPELYRWFSARLQYLQCINNGDTAVLHKAIDMKHFDNENFKTFNSLRLSDVYV